MTDRDRLEGISTLTPSWSLLVHLMWIDPGTYGNSTTLPEAEAIFPLKLVFSALANWSQSLQKPTVETLFSRVPCPLAPQTSYICPPASVTMINSIDHQIILMVICEGTSSPEFASARSSLTYWETTVNRKINDRDREWVGRLMACS